jgi:sugar phosphate isomerase/epimerase
MMRFGAPLFEEDLRAVGVSDFSDIFAIDPYALAFAHRQKGYGAAYAPLVKLSDTTRIADIRRAFTKENVIIAEYAFWNNLLDTDQATRAAHMGTMQETLAIADAIGACCSVNILGGYVHGPGDTAFVARNFAEDAFADAVDIARFMIDTVKPKTARFTYEIFPFNVVDSVDSIERLIRAVDRKEFGVHLDNTNLINSPRTYFASAEISLECVRRFGDRIAAVHIKDIALQQPAGTVILNEVIPGDGGFDLRAFISAIASLPQEVPCLMEHLKSAADYERGAAYIRKCAADVSVKGV